MWERYLPYCQARGLVAVCGDVVEFAFMEGDCRVVLTDDDCLIAFTDDDCLIAFTDDDCLIAFTDDD